MVTKHHKNAARLLNRDCDNRRGLDLSKEVLWVSVCQRAAELPAVKVGGQKKFLPSGPVRTCFACAGPFGRLFLETSNFESWQLCSPLTYRPHITCMERSKPYSYVQGGPYVPVLQNRNYQFIHFWLEISKYDSNIIWTSVKNTWF